MQTEVGVLSLLVAAGCIAVAAAMTAMACETMLFAAAARVRGWRRSGASMTVYPLSTRIEAPDMIQDKIQPDMIRHKIQPDMNQPDMIRHKIRHKIQVHHHLSQLHGPVQSGNTDGDVDEDAYCLFEGGAKLARGKVVAVVQRYGSQQTVLISDEVAADGQNVRRMRFFGPDLVSAIIQAEMRVGDTGRVDPVSLRSAWHCLMVAALAFAAPSSLLVDVCVLGHGAGALSSFLRCVMGCNVTAVDNDAVVLAMARAHFADDNEDVHLADAADFMLHLDVSQRFDAIFLDLNAPSHQPLGAPPACMLTSPVVNALSRASPLVIINVLELEHSREEDYQHVQTVFAPHFATKYMASSVCSNRILVASRTLTGGDTARGDKRGGDMESVVGAQ